MGYLIEFHAPKMTVFSIVTAAFFPENGQGPGRGPGGNKYGDDSGEPPPREDSPAQGRNPGYPDAPARRSREIVEFFKERGRTRVKRNLL